MKKAIKNKKSDRSEMIVYQSKTGAIELRGGFEHENVWATQLQIANIFGVNIRTINEHLLNILKNGELDKNSVIRKFRITALDGKPYNTLFYNLDFIISVGYRVNSKTATEFRKWATKTLREHITKGYTINRNQISSLCRWKQTFCRLCFYLVFKKSKSQEV